MKNVLLIDTNFSSIPLYQSIKKIGYNPFTIGGNSKDFLAKNIANYIAADYSNPKLVLNELYKNKIDFIIPGCNDVSYETSAILNQHFNQPNIETVRNNNTLNNKLLFRNFCLSYEINTPRLITNSKDALNQPVIVKPVDAFSGRGVTVLTKPNVNNLENAIKKAKNSSRSANFLIEEYVEGELYSYSAFIQGQYVCKDFIVAEHCTVNPFVVDTSYVCFDFPEKTRQAIKITIEKIAALLGLKDGLIHLQFILKGEKFWLIEITRRCPGDLYSKLIEASTGYPYAQNYVNTFLGLPYINPVEDKQKYVLRHTITQNSDGIFLDIAFKENFSIEHYYSISTVGDFLKPSPDGRIGIFFAQTGSLQERNQLLSSMLTRELYQILLIED